MVGDSIRRVRQAEDEAEDIVEAAAEQVERLESDARREQSMRMLAAQEKARRDGARARVQALKEAHEEIEAVWKDAGWQQRIVAITGRNRMTEAVAAVLEILEGFGTISDDGS